MRKANFYYDQNKNIYIYNVPNWKGKRPESFEQRKKGTKFHKNYGTNYRGYQGSNYNGNKP